MNRHTIGTRLSSSARTLRDPATQTEMLQLLKATGAAVAAWWIADGLLELAQPFLAAWTALLTVHATIYRTFVRGAQSVLATVLGIGVALTVGELLGVSVVSLAIALVLTQLIARIRFVRTESVTAATTALFILTAGYERQESMLTDRLADTAIGVAVGVLVNLVVFAPLTGRSAAQQIDRVDRQIGALLGDMAQQMGSTSTPEQTQAWIDRTREIDADLERAWQLVSQAHESRWWNPRLGRRRPPDDRSDYADVLIRLEEGVAQVRAMARVVHESTRAAQNWEPQFRDPWLRLIADLGARLADPDREVGSLRDDVDTLTHDLSRDDLPSLLWPEYGALISSTRILIDVVDDVASARPIRP